MRGGGGSTDHWMPRAVRDCLMRSNRVVRCLFWFCSSSTCVCASRSCNSTLNFFFLIFVTPRNSATCKCVAVTLIIIPRPVKSLQSPNAIMCQGLLTHKNPQLQPFCLGPLLLYACKKKKNFFFKPQLIQKQVLQSTRHFPAPNCLSQLSTATTEASFSLHAVGELRFIFSVTQFRIVITAVITTPLSNLDRVY